MCVSGGGGGVFKDLNSGCGHYQGGDKGWQLACSRRGQGGQEVGMGPGHHKEKAPLVPSLCSSAAEFSQKKF